MNKKYIFEDYSDDTELQRVADSRWRILVDYS